jgi:tetratricopeptide (TPR) repeat protein
MRRSFKWFMIFWLVVCSLPRAAFAAELDADLALVTTDTNAQQLLRSYLEVQEQLHSAQLAIERNRREADAAATRNAELLRTKLESLEQALSTQRAKELEAMQSVNRVMLVVAGVFAIAGIAAMLLTTWFQWRTVNRMAEISANLPALRALPAAPVYTAIGNGDGRAASISSSDQANSRLLDSLSRLEQRILELEHTAQPSLPAAEETPAGANKQAMVAEAGQMLDEGKATEALARLEGVLALDPIHPEALLKKADALEKLRRTEEALACYDKAIAADSSLTIAYLQKGGLYNRLERFNEALECYERAMQSQENRRRSQA